MSVSRHFNDSTHGSFGRSTVVINAATTNPTKASSIDFDEMAWSRSGDLVMCTMRYAQPNNTGASAGSGNYLFRLPIRANINQYNIGSCYILSGAEEFHGSVLLNDATTCMLRVQNGTAETAIVSNADYDLATAGDTEYDLCVTYIAG